MTINLELATKPLKNGSYPVFIRISEKSVTCRVGTGVYLRNKEEWDQKKQTVRRANPRCVKMNDTLSILLERARTIERESRNEGRKPDPPYLKMKLQDPAHGEMGLIEYMETYAKGLESIANRKKYDSVINHLRGFMGKRGDIPLMSLCEEDIAGFIEYLKKLPNQRFKGKTLDPNTVLKDFKVIRAALNGAVAKGILKKNPAENIHLKENVKRQRSMTPEEITKITDPVLEKLQDYVTERMLRARDAFVFAYYAAGMRIQDVILLRWENIKGANIHYTQQKTGKEMFHKIPKPALDILEKYREDSSGPRDFVFGYLDSSDPFTRFGNEKSVMSEAMQKKLYNKINSVEVGINTQLRKLADVAGIEPFSFHAARRGLAETMLNATKDQRAVQYALNHNDSSTTDRYLRNNKQSTIIDRALNETFSDGSREERARDLIEQLRNLGYSRTQIKKMI